MNVTLLALNAKYIHCSPAPFYLAAELMDAGQNVRVLDHNVNESRETVLADIVASAPDLLGLSAYIWNITYLRELIPLIKEALPSVRIVLGGPEVSYAARETLLSIPEADGVLSGEGELPMREYAEACEGKRLLSEVKGLSYRSNGGIVVGEPYIGSGTPKSPLNAGYASALKGRIAYIESSRGCPFSCAFCLSGRCGGVRFFELDGVKRDLLSLSRVSRVVKFVDRTFNVNPERTEELLSFLLSHYGKEIPEGACFHFELSGDLIDEKQLALFAKAPRGMLQVEIGLQSFHVPTLRAIRRSAKTERLTENIKKLLALGNVHVHIDLIAGLPEESLADLAHSFDRAYALAPHMLQLGFLKLLHGAPLREEKEKYPCEYASEPPYEVISTPWLSEEDLSYVHTVEEGCDRVYNSGRYRRTLALWRKCDPTASPFRLFFSLGKALLALPRGYTLNDEISLLYEAFLKENIDASSLRDAMLLDHISVNSSRITPTALRREDPLYGKVKTALAKRYPPTSGIRRAVALLSETPSCAFVDYTAKDPVTGEYPVILLPLCEALEEK